MFTPDMKHSVEPSMDIGRTGMGTGDTKTKFSAQRRFICPRKKRRGIRDRDRRQRTMEKGKGTMEGRRDIFRRGIK